jgi:hypothetical protein
VSGVGQISQGCGILIKKDCFGGLKLNLPCAGRIIPADGIYPRRETFMPGLFEDGMWLEAYRTLASGEPPIMFQLLVFNTIMMVFWQLRRKRGLWTIRRETAIGLQVALLLGNIFILLNPDLGLPTMPNLPKPPNIELPM